MAKEIKWDWVTTKDIKVKEPFNINRLRPILDLGKKYQGTLHYAHAAEQMKEAGFDFFRDVRGDGNCFYRAVAVGFITNLAMTKN